jgi:hypothetical protein
MILIGEAARELVKRLRAQLANENKLPGRDCGPSRPRFTGEGAPPAVGAVEENTPAGHGDADGRKQLGSAGMKALAGEVE